MIILASTSATRQAMLRNAGVSFESVGPEVDERALIAQNSEWAAQDIALELASAKALDVSNRFPDAVVVGADQVLALGQVTYSKPRDIDECIKQLSELRAKSHRLISSVACARANQVLWTATDVATLQMRDFSHEFLHDYIARNNARCLMSVGGYQIEDLGLQLFERIEGNYFTILGLPLLQLLSQLRKLGELQS
jgi:septum formation protein